MSSLWSIAVPAARAHRVDLAGTALVLAAAGAVVSLTGVLMESGLRAGTDAGGALSALASSFAGTALVVVLVVVTSTVTLVMRQRRSELALMRTVGATGAQVRSLVSIEVLLVALVAVPVGALPGLWLASTLTPLLVAAGLVDPGFVPALSPLPVLGATLLLVPISLGAGRLAAREAATAAPGTAVRASAVESHQIGTVRRVSAAVLGVGGLAAALTPVFVPGIIGAASAASSALLLVGATACAGPLLVHAALGRAARVAGSRRAPTTRLALSNVHGFSRRLVTVVVPLALVISTGTISTTVDRVVERAAHEQLAAAIGGDLVVTAPQGLAPEELARVTDDPTVVDAAPLGSLPAQVRTDPDDLPDALVWESVALRTVPPDVPSSLFDPRVTAGSLARLSEPDTVSIGSDAAFELGAGVGDRIGMRLGAEDVQLTVVAVHERGLGVGSYLVGPATPAAHHVDVRPDTVLLRTTDGAGPQAGADLGEGATVRTTAGYVAGATSPEAASQRLSSVLLLALLFFVVLGAANAVVLSTRNRRQELALLARTGTTRRQLLRMVRTEALLTAGLAWALGTLAVLPATVAVTVAMLGPTVPVLDLPTYAGLSATAFVIAVGAAWATARRVT